MRHLEHVDGRQSIEEILARVCAAHYLIQAMNDGQKPENYDEVLTEARSFSLLN